MSSGSKHIRSFTELPTLYTERMHRFLGDEYSAFESVYSQPPHSGLRVNLLKISSKQFIEIFPYRLEPIPWSPSGFRFLEDERSQTPPGKHPYHAAGLYYLQEPSAMLVAEVLTPLPGESVLDLSAAPGGKATHIASLMQNKGLLVTNEIHPKRVWDLAENLERWGVRNAVVTNEKPERLANHFGPFFDKVLVDAPCSGEGLFRKDPKARTSWNLKAIASCSARQDTILHSAARLVRPGGLLGYSTCTFAPEENEGTLERFLKANPEFTIVDLPNQPGADHGHPEWLLEPGLAALESAIRLWPHHIHGEGHFVAILQKRKKAKIQTNRPFMMGKLDKDSYNLFQFFLKENLNSFPEDEQVTVVGSYLYRISKDWPDFGSLRVVHPGWWLGTLKKNRFEPAHAFAMGLEKDDIQNCLNLSSQDVDSVKRYLRGENLLSGEGPEGWVMITIDGFPLGWGRNVQGVIKNAYPRGLRWL